MPDQYLAAGVLRVMFGCQTLTSAKIGHIVRNCRMPHIWTASRCRSCEWVSVTIASSYTCLAFFTALQLKISATTSSTLRLSEIPPAFVTPYDMRLGNVGFLREREQIQVFPQSWPTRFISFSFRACGWSLGWRLERDELPCLED